MIDVSINDIKMNERYGLVMQKKDISTAEPKSNLLEVAGRNGVIDLTEVASGKPKYNARTISLSFWVPQRYRDWELLRSRIRNQFEGQKARIIFDDDLAFYWYGRVTSVEMETEGNQAHLIMQFIVDPYKYNVASSIEDWLWDPFDFEQSVINELADIEVDGPTTVDVIVQDIWKNPIVIADSEMTYTFSAADGETASGSIHAGSQVLYECLMKNGTNIFTFTGKGIVSINYVGGSL